MHDIEASAGRSPRGAWWVTVAFLFLCVAALGLRAATAMHGEGGNGLLVARLGLVLPMVIACVMTALAAFGVSRLSVGTAGFWWVIVIAAAVGTLALPFVGMGKGAWAQMIQPAGVVGIDFRAGLYDPAAAFSSASSAWPPLTLVFGRPFTLLAVESGYIAYTVVNVCLGVAVAALSANLGMRAAASRAPGPARGEREVGGRALFFLLALWFLTSYGFLFEVERGNMNLFALVFSLLSLWWLLRYPGSIWVPAVFIAIAINLKIYPGVLVVLLFWRRRWRALLPVVVTNAALLMIAGPDNLWLFIKNNMNVQSAPALWVGNHSAVSFAHMVHSAVGWIPVSMQYLFIAIPVVLWLATAVLLIRQGWSQRSAVLLAAASVPLMNVLTPVSHDYKLVLLVFPFAVLIALLLRDGAALGSPVLRSALGGLVALDAVALHGSTTLWAYSSKYPLIVMVQVFLLIVVLLLRKEVTPQSEGAATLEAGAGPGS